MNIFLFYDTCITLFQLNVIAKLNCKISQLVTEHNYKSISVGYVSHLNFFNRKNVSGCDTVGAVALDQTGNVAFATSTGGITAKRPGRVGDSPIIG